MRVRLLLHRGELRVPLELDQVGQRILNPLVGNVRHLFPLGPAGVLAELDLVALYVIELRLEGIVASDQVRGIADVVVPLDGSASTHSSKGVDLLLLYQHVSLLY